MEIYNPKEWIKPVLYWHKADTMRKLFPYLIIAAVFSWGIAFFELEYLKISEKSWVKNITVVHSLLGFALSLLLVFRTNTAYDRWWEARKQWGALVNSCRILAYKLNAMLPQDDKSSRVFFRKSIFMYTRALIGHLRSDYTTYMLDDLDHPEIEPDKHRPNQIAGLMFKTIHKLYREGKISSEDYRLVDQELNTLTNVCGACERIKNTPIPKSYISFLKKFIVIYVASLPSGFVFSIGYFVAVAVPFVFYVLASLEIIAESIEDPFGLDQDDLPIEKISGNIKKHVEELIPLQ
jgi:putative membrane protein